MLIIWRIRIIIQQDKNIGGVKEKKRKNDEDVGIQAKECSSN
jgi:hypothetical protein